VGNARPIRAEASNAPPTSFAARASAFLLVRVSLAHEARSVSTANASPIRANKALAQPSLARKVRSVSTASAKAIHALRSLAPKDGLVWMVCANTIHAFRSNAPKINAVYKANVPRTKHQNEPGNPDGNAPDGSSEESPTTPDTDAESVADTTATPDIPQGTEDPTNTTEQDNTTEKKIGGAGADETGSEGRYQSPGCACDATAPVASWWLGLCLLAFVLLRRQRIRLVAMRRLQGEERGF
jgi:hypothetical protein